MRRVILSTILFVGLDIRGYSLHRFSVDQMQLLEERIWDSAGIKHLWTPIPRGWRFSSFIKHNWIYRTFFVLTGCRLDCAADQAPNLAPPCFPPHLQMAAPRPHDRPCL